ncbi:hypothetical protein QBC35DRAFT_526132 [Podospora australis]|uniref:Uncharacterized protein n=1 Tax=Podospora australis TaxID=1536484 RepID=A0AAN6WL61_9PEZI|nr:hypothetical protein QBC35DRAFT_526132 [Podospora australis]
MKTAYILASLALGLRVEARQIPADKLEARQRGGGGGFGGGGGGGAACTWTGHCLGDACKTEIDCDGDLDCRSGKCANPVAGGQPTPSRQPTPSSGPIIRTTTVYVYPSSTRGPVRPTSTVRATPVPSAPSSGACEWTGHCIGDPCVDENECDLDYVCRSGRCAALSGGLVTTTRRATSAPPVITRTTARTTTAQPPVSTRRPGPACGDNPLSCIGKLQICISITLSIMTDSITGVSCSTDADCGFDLIICKNGFCGL